MRRAAYNALKLPEKEPRSTLGKLVYNYIKVPYHAPKEAAIVGSWVGWFTARGRSSSLPGFSDAPEGMHPELKEHYDFARKEIKKASGELALAVFKYKIKLADRQKYMNRLSRKIQSLILMAATAVEHAHEQDPEIRLAADMGCHDLRYSIPGQAPDMKYDMLASKLGEKVFMNEFTQRRVSFLKLSCTTTQSYGRLWLTIHFLRRRFDSSRSSNRV